MTIAILWPTFALVALIFVVWFVMFAQRTAYMKRNPPAEGELASGDAAMRYFAPVEMSANNLRNLFEMPVLFFALVPLLLVTRHADHVQVLLAWGYVLARVAHSAIHIARGPVGMRFLAYFISCIILSAMWIGFAVDMISAASLAPPGTL